MVLLLLSFGVNSRLPGALAPVGERLDEAAAAVAVADKFAEEGLKRKLRAEAVVDCTEEEGGEVDEDDSAFPETEVFATLAAVVSLASVAPAFTPKCRIDESVPARRRHILSVCFFFLWSSVFYVRRTFEVILFQKKIFFFPPKKSENIYLKQLRI